MNKPSSISLFICGRSLTVCFVCGYTARMSCQFDGCERPLCETHARKRDGQTLCAKHAPMTTNENMPKPPPPFRGDT